MKGGRCFNMNKILHKKDGFMSVVGIILGGALFITLLWLMMDLTYYAQQNRSTKNILDNATASAVTLIDESSLGDGNIRFLEQEAIDMAKKIIMTDLFLDENGQPTPQSPLKESPVIQIYVVDEVDRENGTLVDVGGIKKMRIYNPSVIAYASLPIRGLFIKGKGPVFHQISASQVTY